MPRVLKVTNVPLVAPTRSVRQRARTRLGYSQVPVLVGVWLLLIALTAAGLLWPTAVPVLAFIVPMIVAGQLLSPRHMPPFFLAVTLCVAVVVAAVGAIDLAAVIRVIVIAASGLMILLASARRAHLGVGSIQGETLLTDLHRRIVSMGAIPALPDGWVASSALKSAGGTQFGGDFVVVHHSRGRLDLVLVDVSGKGVPSATRSLILSGAFGALLGALAPEAFLGAANSYLNGRDWEEGFATAVHVHLNLADGAFEVRTAGHPPALLVRADGTVRRISSGGPALGVVEDQQYAAAHGSLDVGEGLVLYTDGMVEIRGADIDSGIDALAAKAAQAQVGGQLIPVSAMVRHLGRADDDRALIVVHRLSVEQQERPLTG